MNSATEVAQVGDPEAKHLHSIYQHEHTAN